MSALIVISAASLANDGITVTCNISGGVAPYSPSSGITGLAVQVAGGSVPISSTAIAASVLTLTLGAVVFTGAPITISISAASNLTDASANTAKGQTGIIVSNGSLNWPYGNKADIDTECGAFNASVFADPDSTGNAAAITSHYQKAGSFAQAQIDSRLNAQGFATPAIQSAVNLNQCWQQIAAYELYQVRGLEDQNQKAGGYANAFECKRKEALSELRRMIKQSIFNPGAAGSFVIASGQPSDPPQSVAPCIDNILGLPVRTSKNPWPFWFGYPFSPWLGWAG